MSDEMIVMLAQYYERFSVGHERLRRELLDKLRVEEQPTTEPGGRPPAARPPAPPRRRWLLPAALSGVAALVALVLLPSLLAPRAGVSWAQVVGNLRRAQTLTCRVTGESRYADGTVAVPARTLLKYLRSPDQWREEDDSPAPASRPSSDPPAYHLVNAAGHPGTSLIVSRGAADLTSDVTFGLGPGSISPGLGEWLTRLRAMDDKRITREGEEKVAGRTLVRFGGPSEACDATVTGGKLTAWVDPATALPVRLLLKGPAPFERVPKQMTIDMTDLQFDRPLKDELFEWPDLGDGGRRVEQTLAVHVPRHIPTEKLRLTIGPPDGPALVGPADLVPKSTMTDFAGRRLFLALTPEARQRVSEYTAGHIGQKLRVSVGDVGSEEVAIIGRFDHVRVTVPVEQVPATAPAPRPRPAADRPSGAADQRRWLR